MMHLFNAASQLSEYCSDDALMTKINARIETRNRAAYSVLREASGQLRRLFRM
jgi:hypothetical protein